MDPDLIQADALGTAGSFRARNRQRVADVTGAVVAELSLVPTLFVSRTLSALRAATSLAVDDRRKALERAGELFRTETIGGLTVEEYQTLTSRVSGLGISVIRQSTDRIATYCASAHDRAHYARPQGAVGSLRHAQATAGAAVWTRRGGVFGVHAAGNHPAVHANWLEALALGYRVAVRPSRREPFTPYRLVSALRAAGFGDDQVAFLPTDHEAAEAMLRGSDRSMVYGGDEVIRKFAADPYILPQGPGRSKIVITADVDWREHLNLVVESISKNGGVGCTNTTAVLIDGDPVEFARAVAERLSVIPSLPSLDPEAVLPVQPLETAHRIEDYLKKAAIGAMPVLGGSGIIDDCGDGSAVLRPAVHVLGSAQQDQIGVELPFPCVWVSPWTPGDGTGALKNTLALTVIGQDAGLAERLLDEPSIRNVYLGPHSTLWSAPGVPHDGYLADFLMESKGFIGTRADSLAGVQSPG